MCTAEVRKRSKANAHVTGAANVEWAIHTHRRPPPWNAYFYVHHLILICSGAKHKCRQESRARQKWICVCGCGRLSCAYSRLIAEDECTSNSKCSVVALCLFAWFGRPHLEDDLHDGLPYSIRPSMLYMLNIYLLMCYFTCYVQ